jgi:type II secretory ATPase GspE/PulE/Tfp pilus assembly ATPase PilB-like protein
MEILLVDDELRALVLKNASATVLREAAQEKGMKTLRDVGMQRVREGTTSIQEVLRVTSGE